MARQNPRMTARRNKTVLIEAAPAPVEEAAPASEPIREEMPPEENPVDPTPTPDEEA